ncbi:hypothetical protein F5I97DRAFT_1390591 [Phlebopus sp. FC_14]|nr:hypothetical protein F5I97DRAFT_1390591 [Phlebopus sp. FC_14]
MSQETVDLNCIGWDVHIVSAISFQENIRLALLRNGVIRAVTRVLPFIISQNTSIANRPLAARCIVNASAFLNTRLEDLDGVPLVIEAIDSDVIPSLMKCEPLLPYADHATARDQPITLLGSVLARYTIYRSVLRPTLLSMDAVEASRMELNLIKDGQLHQAWIRLKEVVAERRRLLGHDIADGYHIQSCQNHKCGRAGEIGSFKRCGGCLHTFYCSKACQRDDWRDGKHHLYCNGVHRRYLRTDGQMAGLRQKDIRFLDQVIIAELRKHTARINAHHLKTNVVEFNFVGQNVDTIFDSRRVKPAPFGIKCSCEKFAHEMWNRMIEKAKEAPEPLILARTYIPGGMSRKVLLRALPLRCVLEDVSRTYYREDKNSLTFPSHLSLAYTCCGRNSLEKETTTGKKRLL